ncbi:MAG: pro-sigmaK processing inhibitor BofA family protein [Clostridia bacterium]
MFGANASVGLNPVTAGVCGILGIPGAAMLMIIHQIL